MLRCDHRTAVNVGWYPTPFGQNTPYFQLVHFHFYLTSNALLEIEAQIPPIFDKFLYLCLPVVFTMICRLPNCCELLNLKFEVFHKNVQMCLSRFYYSRRFYNTRSFLPTSH